MRRSPNAKDVYLPAESAMATARFRSRDETYKRLASRLQDSLVPSVDLTEATVCYQDWSLIRLSAICLRSAISSSFVNGLLPAPTVS